MLFHQLEGRRFDRDSTVSVAVLQPLAHRLHPARHRQDIPAAASGSKSRECPERLDLGCFPRKMGIVQPHSGILHLSP